MNDAEIAKYLDRIKVNACNPNLEGLTKLQNNHMENIPFENLDILAGRKIVLDHEHLYNKIISKHRGGYCFELNTLFANLLKALGFTLKPVLGRVWLSNPKTLPPRNHLAYLVELGEKKYITDVGFGGLISRVPLDINNADPVNDEDGMIRVVSLSNHEFMIERQSEKEWKKLYSFEDLPVSVEDIQISNYYMSTNPNSHFCCHKFVGRNNKDGRIALFNNKMSIRKGIKVVDKKPVQYGEEWLRIAKDDFSLKLDFSEEEISNLFKDIV